VAVFTTTLALVVLALATLAFAAPAFCFASFVLLVDFLAGAVERKASVSSREVSDSKVLVMCCLDKVNSDVVHV
jgi:hypothetical protein